MFERAHHNRIAQVLTTLDAQLLRDNRCLFGGGTAIALRHGEYRESIDIDFLVSNIGNYRALRQLLNGPAGVQAIARAGAVPLVQVREVKSDQYGIRTMLMVDGQTVKFEIVLEARISLEPPIVGSEICGISTLTPLDMMACKLLANSDRWRDDGAFSRDLIDLAMMQPSRAQLRLAINKAIQAYGDAIEKDLSKAIDSVRDRHGWLERCMQAMAMTQPKAQLWQHIRALGRALPQG